MRLREPLDALDLRVWHALGRRPGVHFATRCWAVLGLVYALGLLVILAVGSTSWWSLAVVTPWSAAPLIAVVAGRQRLLMAFVATLLSMAQVLLLLPAYGFGVVYLPIAACSLTAMLAAGLASRRGRRQPHLAAVDPAD